MKSSIAETYVNNNAHQKLVGFVESVVAMSEEQLYDAAIEAARYFCPLKGTCVSKCEPYHFDCVFIQEYTRGYDNILKGIIKLSRKPQPFD